MKLDLMPKKFFYKESPLSIRMLSRRMRERGSVNLASPVYRSRSGSAWAGLSTSPATSGSLAIDTATVHIQCRCQETT